jgi:hypothetical protein
MFADMSGIAAVHIGGFLSWKYLYRFLVAALVSCLFQQRPLVILPMRALKALLEGRIRSACICRLSIMSSASSVPHHITIHLACDIRINYENNIGPVLFVFTGSRILVCISCTETGQV